MEKDEEYDIGKRLQLANERIKSLERALDGSETTQGAIAEENTRLRGKLDTREKEIARLNKVMVAASGDWQKERESLLQGNGQLDATLKTVREYVSDPTLLSELALRSELARVLQVEVSQEWMVGRRFTATRTVLEAGKAWLASWVEAEAVPDFDEMPQEHALYMALLKLEDEGG